MGDFTRPDAGGGFPSRTESAAKQTTNATETLVWSRTMSSTQSTWVLDVVLIGTKSGGTDRASFWRRATVYRAGSGALAFQGAVLNPGVDAKSDGTWGDINVTADTNDVQVKVTGKAATTINWRAYVTLAMA